MAGGLGHQPERFAALAKERFLDGFEVEITPDLAVLESSELNQRDLILPVWTQGELTWKQERGVLRAIEEGTEEGYQSSEAIYTGFTGL